MKTSQFDSNDLTKLVQCVKYGYYKIATVFYPVLLARAFLYNAKDLENS